MVFHKLNYNGSVDSLQSLDLCLQNPSCREPGCLSDLVSSTPPFTHCIPTRGFRACCSLYLLFPPLFSGLTPSLHSGPSSDEHLKIIPLSLFIPFLALFLFMALTIVRKHVMHLFAVHLCSTPRVWKLCRVCCSISRTNVLMSLSKHLKHIFE